VTDEASFDDRAAFGAQVEAMVTCTWNLSDLGEMGQCPVRRSGFKPRFIL